VGLVAAAKSITSDASGEPCRSAAVQQGIVAALSAVARGLDRAGRLALMTELPISSRRAADEPIRASVLRLLAVLRSSLETRT
jgi:hypothetical protein